MAKAQALDNIVTSPAISVLNQGQEGISALPGKLEFFQLN